MHIPPMATSLIFNLSHEVSISKLCRRALVQKVASHRGRGFDWKDISGLRFPT